MSTFTHSVAEVVRCIPKGKVLTYAEVASQAGNPKAYRAVANFLAKNYDTTIPCHRVIRKNGTLGGYNRGGEVAKRILLEQEGYFR
jgi:O-6-methylguanine DNA methyltransferase